MRKNGGGRGLYFKEMMDKPFHVFKTEIDCLSENLKIGKTLELWRKKKRISRKKHGDIPAINPLKSGAYK